MVEIAAGVLLVYGFVLIVGGVLGYVVPEKPSKVSLAAGGLTGIVAIVAYLLVPHQQTAAFIAGILVASLNEAAMAVRWQKTGKFMPAGFVVLLSGAVFVVLVLALVWKE